ncbi:MULTISPECIES: hypothetical protein [Cytobacillus]|uniref:hypothetical protein n=1 Tax=Cytobacillus TaxID=2675230 RepID=UPI0025A00771|nr:hypothetical protein [Cytobacillus kochii]MDM5208443.1 hypothetical protein [Cytobacillus kochii]
MSLPIHLELIKKHEEIPVKLAELSYIDQQNTITLLRKWGEDKAPISVLHSELCECLEKDMKGGEHIENLPQTMVSNDAS